MRISKKQSPIGNSRVVRTLRGGQMTIPTEFRKALRIEPDGFLQVTLERGELRIRPLRVAEPTAGSPWLKDLYELFSPVRAEAAQQGEGEVNQAIDRAVRAVRRRRA